MADMTVELGPQLPITVRIGKHECIMDVPERLGGTDAAPSPTDYFLASIAACKVFYAYMYLSRHNLMSGTIRATAEASKGKDHVESVMIKLELPPGIPEKDRAGVERMVKACFVRQSIEQDMEIQDSIDYGDIRQSIERDLEVQDSIDYAD